MFAVYAPIIGVAFIDLRHPSNARGKLHVLCSMISNENVSVGNMNRILRPVVLTHLKLQVSKGEFRGKTANQAIVEKSGR